MGKKGSREVGRRQTREVRKHGSREAGKRGRRDFRHLFLMRCPGVSKDAVCLKEIIKAYLFLRYGLSCQGKRVIPFGNVQRGKEQMDM